MFLPMLMLTALTCAVGAAAGSPHNGAAAAPKIHSVTDIAHEFTFYFDGRFAANYIGEDGADARCWATLHKYDLSNANLLVLQSGASPCPYLPQDVAAARRFLNEGGGVVILGDYALFRDEKEYRLNEMAGAFGAEFVTEPAKEPLGAAPELMAESVRTYGGKTVRLKDPSEWKVLLRDAGGRVVMARRQVGRGQLLVASRALAGRQPDAQDPINGTWWRPLLRDLARGKTVDPARPPEGMMPENAVDRGGLRLRYTDYMQPYANAILRIYRRCRPAMERILGVPPSKNMMTSLILLPTGGGGFSDGTNIALGVWWGDFPKQEYGMVELLGHEGTHSWVLPFPEPMWNEGIATYVGILLGRELGLAQEADASLKGWLDGALKLDPDMTKYDIAQGKDVPHVVGMAKPMWIFEQLRKEKPDIVARYFQAKRRLMDPSRRDRYTADDCVAVLSAAMGRDLFPWFRSLGTSVDRARTTVAP
jgi:hypothetical protein